MKLAKLEMYLIFFSIFLEVLVNDFFFIEYGNNTLGDTSNFALAATWLPILLGFIVLVSLRGTLLPLPQYWRSLFGFVFVVFLLGALIGAFNAYEPKRYLGDLLKFLVPWMTLYLMIRASMTIASLDGFDKLHQFMNGLIVVAFLEGVLTIVAGLTFRGVHIAGILFFLGLSWSLLNPEKNVFRYVVSGVVILAAVISWKRSYILFLIWTVFCCLFYLTTARRLKLQNTVRFFVFLVFLILTLLSLFPSIFNIVKDSPARFTKIIDIINGSNYDESYNIRRNEEKNVLHFYKRNPTWLLTGMGFGCEVPARWKIDEINYTEHGNMHHVHKTFFLILLRDGVLGLMLFAFFLLKVFRMLFEELKFQNWRKVVFSIFFMMQLLGSLEANFMISSVITPIVVSFIFIFGNKYGADGEYHEH